MKWLAAFVMIDALVWLFTDAYTAGQLVGFVLAVLAVPFVLVMLWRIGRRQHQARRARELRRSLVSRWIEEDD